MSTGAKLWKWTEAGCQLLLELPFAPGGIAHSAPIGQFLVPNSQDGSIVGIRDNGKIEVLFPPGSFLSPNAICSFGHQIFVEEKKWVLAAGDVLDRSFRQVIGGRGMFFLLSMRPDPILLKRRGGLAVSDDGIYMASPERNRILRIDHRSVVHEAIGNGNQGCGIGSDARHCSLSRPCGVAFYKSYLFVADTGNALVRVFRHQEEKSIPLMLLGRPNQRGSEDGAPQDCRFDFPTDMGSGRLGVFVADCNLLRRVEIDETACVVKTVHEAKEEILALAVGPKSLLFLTT